jgi:hypothetical protein
MESYGGMILTGKTEELGEKSIPVSLFSPQTPQRDANPDLRGDRPPTSDVRWKIFRNIFSQKIFRFLKSSLNISFLNLFLVALGLGGFESCICSYLTVAVCCVSRCNDLSSPRPQERNIKR